MALYKFSIIIINCSCYRYSEVCDFCTVQLQIEEITRRLRTGELGIPTNPGDR